MFTTAWFTMVRERLTDEKDSRWAGEVSVALIPDFGNLISISVSGAQAALLRAPRVRLIRSHGENHWDHLTEYVQPS